MSSLNGELDLKELNDRELLLLIAYRVNGLDEDIRGSTRTKGLLQRVDCLESDRDKIRGLKWLGGGGGIIGLLTAVWHYLQHYGGK